MNKKLLFPAIALFLCFGMVQNSPIETNAAALDFEFKTNSSVSDFVSSSGLISWANDALVLATSQQNAELISPVFSSVDGNKYCMKMDVRNTLFFRIKNATNATKVKVYFTTLSDTSFSEDKCLELDINKDEYQSLFVDFSSLSKAKGYLKQFKLVFNNTDNNEISIDAISVEREKKLLNYAGEIESCLANKDTQKVTVIGSVKDEFAGHKVSIYRSDLKNYNESLSYPDLKLLAEKNSESNGTFTIDFDLMYNEQTNLLSSQFIAVVDETKISESFVIENYQDFSIAGARFTLPNREVKVTDAPFNAKGDAFTDDTNAIQAAIDHVSQEGGGRVVIPGNDDEVFGRRFMMTHIEMKSNVELFIDENAVLWQDPRIEDYHYHVEGYEDHDKPIYGHESNIPGVMWCHACATYNLPFIYAEKVENIRICGKGQIRMMDTGVIEEDAAKFLGDPGMNKGCNNIIHLSPMCFNSVDHLDVRDISVYHACGWHCTSSQCSDVYYANIIEHEISCVTSDGFSFSASKNCLIERCMTYTSDDGFVMSSSYNDPRHFMFNVPNPQRDRVCENIVVKDSFIWGGFGCSLIPWGSGHSDFSQIYLKNLEFYNNIVGGQKSVGVWPDDPFYGRSSYEKYNGTEDYDYVPMSDFYYHNNTYLNGFDLYLNSTRAPITNLIVDDCEDNTAKAPSNFILGGFDRRIRSGEGFADETNFLSGLAYWSNEDGENASYGSEKIEDGQGFSGFVKGNGFLFQGLYEEAGYYRLIMKTLLEDGEAKILVKDSKTNEIIYEKKLAKSKDLEEQICEFNIDSPRNVKVGVLHTGGANEKVYFDDCQMIRIEDKRFLNAFGKVDFEKANPLFSCGTDVLEEQNHLKNIKTALKSAAYYNEFDLGGVFKTAVKDAELNLTLKDEALNESTKYTFVLANLGDNKEHSFGLRISETKIDLFVDYELFLTKERTDEFINFKFELSSNEDVLIDELDIEAFNALIFVKEKEVIDIRSEEGYQIQYVQEPKFVGDVCKFRVDSEDDVVVTINGVEVSPVEGVYEFEATGNDIVIIAKKIIPPTPDPKSNFNPLFVIIPCGVVVVAGLGVLIFFLVKKHKASSMAIFFAIGALGGVSGGKAIESNAATKITDPTLICENLTTTNQLTADSLTIDHTKLVMSDKTNWTEFIFGYQTGTDTEQLSFDYTCDYDNPAYGSVTLQFRRWDPNSTFKLKIDNSGLTLSIKNWSDEAGTGVETVLQSVSYPIEEGKTYHFDLLLDYWNKMFFIDGNKVFSYYDSHLATGYIGFESWQTAYTLTNMSYMKDKDQELFDKPYIEDIKTSYVEQLQQKQVSDPIVNEQILNLINEFKSKSNALISESAIKALFIEYSQKIDELDVDGIKNYSKMKKIYNSLTFENADTTLIKLTPFDTIYLPSENNKNRAFIYDPKIGTKCNESITFAPFILNEWTTCIVRFNYTDDNNCYAFDFTDKAMTFYKKDGGATSILKKVDINCTEKVFKIDFFAVGSSMKVFVNNEEFYTLENVSFTSNKMHVYSWNGGYTVKDICALDYKVIQDGIDFVNSLNLEQSVKDEYIEMISMCLCEADVLYLELDAFNQ